MKRRQFITLLPVQRHHGRSRRARSSRRCRWSGFSTAGAPDADPSRLSAFHQGLKEAGFVEGQNVAIEYRLAANDNDRLPALAADLVRRQVAVIVATGPATLAAKAATTTIPIVFAMGADPVQLGLVASLNRPGGNVTGVVTSLMRSGRSGWNCCTS